MKRITILVFMGITLFLTNSTKAQSPIAVQNDSGSSFYSTFDEAITNAIAGDYIYLPGGVFTISVPIDKQLQIIGVGHNPDSCATTGITQITGNIVIKNGSDHGSLTGLKIPGTISFGTSPYTDVSITYYTIERCNIGGAINLATNSTNFLINECILQGILYGHYTQGFQLSKSIIYTNLGGYQLNYFGPNAYFVNNIFLPNVNYNNNLYMNNIKECYFRNNIFLSRVQDPSGGSGPSINNQFQNNLFNAGHPSGQSLSTTTNFFRYNITGPVTTLFVNQSGIVFDYKHDYHIKTDSPAHNAGTDGTDLGIYGTGNPWKEGSLPSNPHIQSKSISTVDGNLNVKIKVATQEN